MASQKLAKGLIGVAVIALVLSIVGYVIVFLKTTITH